MPSFTYFYKIRVDLQKFSSGDELFDKWSEEASAALGAVDAGVLQIWKDAADATVYAIITTDGANAVEAHGEALKLLKTVPMGASGELVIDEARSLISYGEWADYLSNRSA